jgi:hypothetical protein
MCSDCETYISADDLRINLWNLEVSDQSFNIVDIKPTNMEDLTGIPSRFLIVSFITLNPLPAYVYYISNRGMVLFVNSVMINSLEYCKVRWSIQSNQLIK